MTWLRWAFGIAVAMGVAWYVLFAMHLAALWNSVAHAGGPAQQVAPDDGWDATAVELTELLPPEHRLFAFLGLGALGLGAWFLHIRFGKGQMAQRQRDAVAALQGRPLDGDEREELEMYRSQGWRDPDICEQPNDQPRLGRNRGRR